MLNDYIQKRSDNSVLKGFQLQLTQYFEDQITIVLMKGVKYFILSHQALSLYRNFMKTIFRIPHTQTRNQIREQVRADFEKYRHVEDIEKMEYLIVTGRTQLKQLSGMVG